MSQNLVNWPSELRMLKLGELAAMATKFGFGEMTGKRKNDLKQWMSERHSFQKLIEMAHVWKFTKMPSMVYISNFAF